jgi:hypothetical protein
MLDLWNNSPQDLFLHLDTFSWFIANQSLLFLLKVCLSGEVTNIFFFNLWFDTTGAQISIYRTQGEFANHYTNDAIVYFSVEYVNGVLTSQLGTICYSMSLFKI